MLRFLRERLDLRIRGAAPERCLNRWTQADIPFRDLRREGDLSFRCRICGRDLARARREAARAQCELELLGSRGLPVLLRRLRARPVLSLGVPAAVALVLWLQGFVWFLQVEGNRELPRERILHALAEEGVAFGSWGPDVNSEALKHRMLNRIPELRWMAVNREGGVLHVLVAEREPEEPPAEPKGPASITAVRPGLIRELSVIRGFAAVEPGDRVETGQLLISGQAEWTTHIQLTRARGEVYADTFREKSLMAPETVLEKVYTGRVEQCRTIIFQRKRRKISGNSGIFGTMCDRMVKTSPWILPGGLELPIAVETMTLREYRLRQVPLSREAAETLLDREALRLTEGELVAGRVLTGSTAIQKKENSYRCSAAFNCLEQIGVTRPLELYGEDEDYGEAHQRGAD